MFGTSYGNASIGTTLANTSRVNNSINNVTPSFGGLMFGATYSLGNSTDDAEWQDKGHTFALAANYQTDRLFLTLTFANVDQAHNEAVLLKATEDADGNKIPEVKGTNADGRAYQVGAWYRLTPDFRIFAGAGWQTHWATGAKFGASADFNAVTGVTGEEREGGWKGLSAVLGADYVVGKHKFMADVQYFDGEM